MYVCSTCKVKLAKIRTETTTAAAVESFFSAAALLLCNELGKLILVLALYVNAKVFQSVVAGLKISLLQSFAHCM